MIVSCQTNCNITNIVTIITRKDFLVSLPLVGGGFTEGGVFVEEGVGIATGTKTASYMNEYSYKQ